MNKCDCGAEKTDTLPHSSWCSTFDEETTDPLPLPSRPTREEMLQELELLLNDRDTDAGGTP